MILAASLATVADAHAAGKSLFSDRAAIDQADLRLSAISGPDGTVRGALTIRLRPGWHTYWKDPGHAGIPPHLVFKAAPGIAETALAFPAPKRFGEGATRSVGYDRAVAIAFTLTPIPGRRIEAVDLDALLGVCREICIPLTANLEAEVDAPGAPMRVAAAFGALPSPAPDDLVAGVRLSRDGETLLVEALPKAIDTVPSDLFVAGPQDWSFGATQAKPKPGGHVEFAVEILSRPKTTAQPPAFDLLFETEDGSYEATGRRPTDG